MRKVTRAGFRREDDADNQMQAGLRASAAAILDVIRELDRLLSRLSDKVALSDAGRDRDQFDATFKKFYEAKSII